MTRPIIAAAFAALAALPVSHAIAGTPNPVLVSYGDLDLNTNTGRTELNSRVRAAASNLCSPVLSWPIDSEPSIHHHQVLYEACVGRLANRAIARIGTTNF